MKHGLTADDLFAVASMFTDDGGSRGEVFARPGKMAASDGRMILRIESPIITEIQTAYASVADSFFNFAPEAETRLAGRKWIEGALFPEIKRQATLEGVRLEKMREQARADAWRAEIVHCPCCGAKLVIEDSDLLQYSDWQADHEPNPRFDGGTMALTGARVSDGRMAFKVFYLDRLRLAGERLGDIEGLYCGSFHLVLRGAGWFVTLASLRHCNEEHAGGDEVAVPEEEGSAE
jgi:hypothetical protein